MKMTGTGNFGCTFAFELSRRPVGKCRGQKGEAGNQGNSGFVRGRGNQANGTAFRNGRLIGRGGEEAASS